MRSLKLATVLLSLGCCDAPSIGPVSPRIETVNENVVRINGSEITSRQSIEIRRDGEVILRHEGRGP